MKIGILNAGVGSIHSLQNSLRLLGESAETISITDSFSDFTHLIFPGVGHFDQGSLLVSESKLNESLKSFLGNPNNRLLGICLGMQILFSTSEESSKESKGLGFFDARIKKLPLEEAKVPNLGWLPIFNQKVSDEFISDSIDCQDFYFVHSYGLVDPISESFIEKLDEFSISFHGSIPFLSIFRHSNIYGCQFHPEKSSRHGLAVLSNFLF